MSKRYAVHVDFNPDDPGENWKHTKSGCLARLKECEDGMERERGTGLNLRWYYWHGEWQLAWHWLEKRMPRVARTLAELWERERNGAG